MCTKKINISQIIFNTSKQNIETYIKELKKIIEEDIH